jgi:hypothetical protein
MPVMRVSGAFQASRPEDRTTSVGTAVIDAAGPWGLLKRAPHCRPSPVPHRRPHGGTDARTREGTLAGGPVRLGPAA